MTSTTLSNNTIAKPKSEVTMTQYQHTKLGKLRFRQVNIVDIDTARNQFSLVQHGIKFVFSVKQVSQADTDVFNTSHRTNFLTDVGYLKLGLAAVDNIGLPKNLAGAVVEVVIENKRYEIPCTQLTIITSENVGMDTGDTIYSDL